MDGSASLAGWLRTRGDEELAALLAARPDLANPVPADVAGLAARAATRASVLRALDDLDRRELAVVEALALLDEPASYDGLAALVRDELGAPAELRAAVDAVRRLALVWGADDQLRLVRAARELGPMPGGLGPPAGVAVAGYFAPMWQALLDELGLEAASSAAQAGARVAAYFADPATLPAAVAGLTPAEREVLDRLTWSGLGAVHDAWVPYRSGPDEPPWRRLLARGLLVAPDPMTVVVPREVGLALRGGRVFPPGFADRPEVHVRTLPVTAVDRAAAAQAMASVRAVTELLDGWGAEPPKVVRSGRLGVRELRRAARDLDLPEPQVALYVEVAYAAGLLGSTGADPVWAPTTAYDGWRRTGVEHRWTALAEGWLATPRVPGLAGSRDERDQVVAVLGPDLERAGAVRLRRLALSVLDEQGPGAAPEVADVVATVDWLAPRRRREGADEQAAWAVEEAEALGVTGRGALSAFGRALLAGEPAEAARVLATLLPEPVDHVLVQADLTAVAPGPLVPDLARELALVAQVESKGGATVYRFTAESVRRALDAGRSATDLHQLLNQRSRTPVPQPLHYLIDDVARRHGRIRVGTAQSYVRSDDPAVLQEILAAKRAAGLGLRLLAPTVLAAEAAPERVLEVLRSLGQAPVAESSSGDMVVGQRREVRAGARPRAAWLGGSPALPPHLVSTAVRAIRAGERASAAAPRLTRPASVADAWEILTDAAERQQPVWIGYLNAEGEASRRLVEPRWVSGREMSAFDHRSGEVRTFLVHRVTGVAPVDEADLVE